MLPLVTTRRVTSTGQAPSGAPGQELAADRVAHVVGQQGAERSRPSVGDEGRRHVGLERHGVARSGLAERP